MTTVASRNGQGSPTPTLRIPAFSAASIPAASQSKATHSEGSAPNNAACCKSGSGSDLAYETRLPSNTQSNRERIPVRSRIAGASRRPSRVRRKFPRAGALRAGKPHRAAHRPRSSARRIPCTKQLGKRPILTFCPASKGPVRPPARSRIPSASKRLTPRSDSFCNSVNSNPSSAASLFPCEETTAGRIDDHAVQTEQTGFYHNFTKSIGYSIQSKTAYRRERSDKVRDRSIPFSKHRPKEGKIYEAARPIRPGLPNGPYRETRYRPGRTLRKQALPPQDQGR